MNNENELVRNLKRFRRWLCENAVSRVVNGFLPTFLDDKSRKIEVIVNDSMKPCTDGKTIYVSLIQDFLEDGWTVSEWMIALKAVTAHEAEHVNSSNFTDVEEIRTWYGKYLADTYNLDPTIGVLLPMRKTSLKTGASSGLQFSDALAWFFRSAYSMR